MDRLPAPALPLPIPPADAGPGGPALRQRPARRGLRARLLPLLLTGLLSAGCASVVNPVSGRSELTVMSEADEIALGAKGHAQIVAQQGVVDNPALAAYVDRIGQRLAAQSHRAHLRWTFTVLDSPEVNAFALPGGYVYVTRGILAVLRDEAELAGVLGHEIGHVTARHGAQRATRQQTAGLGVLAATVFGAAFGLGDVAQQLSSAAAAGVVASYGREQELQADQLGAEYLARNDYAPQRMIDVIAALKRQELHAAAQARAAGREASAGGASWLASHPSNAQRLQQIRRIAEGYPAPEQPVEGRSAYLAALDGLDFGDSPAQGLVRGRVFVHPGLEVALTAPEGWRLRNTPEALVVAHPDGQVGLLLRPVPPQAGRDPRVLARKLYEPIELRTEPRNLHGLDATLVQGRRKLQGGGSQPFELLVVEGPQDKLYLLQQAGAAEALRREQAALREAAASFRPLGPADRSLVRPWKLRSAVLPPGGWARLAADTPLPPAEAEALLRLLNGADPVEGETRPAPRPGDRVKTVRAD
ncbi:M48 family metalloprotease [Aquariibacter lacus]|uniref:M48 family metalloprotease n=1 Tax=Aquariibacter lacus TaxID=2801332 RepID=UPI00257445FA|nr:M48 family metalloprotease [Piscinibacter lacus]